MDKINANDIHPFQYKGNLQILYGNNSDESYNWFDYGGSKTDGICWIKNNICPVCWKQTEEKNFVQAGHHIIPCAEGGSDSYVNVIKICRTCHGVVTMGNNTDVVYIDNALIHHQLWRFGSDFIFFQDFKNSRYKNDLDNNFIIGMKELFISAYKKYRKETTRDWRETFNVSLAGINFYIQNLNAYLYFRDCYFGKVIGHFDYW